jgi:UDP-N-acetyl-D-glucosamine dehydrogenase
MVQGDLVTTNLVVIGQGYVGLPMALRAAEVGMRVVGYDSNPNVVERLNNGSSHIGDISDSQLGAALRAGFTASADPTTIANADVVVVCVPTPLTDEGGPDLAPVEAAATAIGKHARPGTLCILESTTYPGTTEEVFAPLVCGERLHVGTDVFIAFSPERIDPGNQKFGVQNTPKVVGGLTPECGDRARRFYAEFIDTVVKAKSAREAEMAKLLENTFRHVNIALMNEMIRFSHELDIDLWDAIDCAETKPFGFMAFRPGPGVGGHCIPVDPSYLSHRVKAKLGYAFRLVELAEEINHAAPLYVAGRLQALLNADSKPVNGSRILLLGVTYKPNISDRRESPADPLGRQLVLWGADLRYHDPYVPVWHLETAVGVHEVAREPDLDQAIRAADVVVLLQQHKEYDLAIVAQSAVRFLDTRGVVPNGANLERL